MSQPTVDLSELFGVALQAMEANRQDVNALDGYNGNHGDNMVENLRLITDALREQSSQPPAEALRHASQQLQTQGRGGTSQYYANGLSRAANQFQGRSSLDRGDIMGLAQLLLGSIPQQGHPQQTSIGDTVLGEILGSTQPRPGDTGVDAGDILGALLGGGQPSQPQAETGVDAGDLLGALLGGGQPPQPTAGDTGLDAEDVLGTLVSAGVAFFQAKQAGADPTAAVTQAVMNALLGGQMNPLQAGTARSAAGSLVVQSMLQALTGGG